MPVAAGCCRQEAAPYNWSWKLTNAIQLRLAEQHSCTYSQLTAGATALARQANPNTISSPSAAIAAPAREIAG